MKRTHVLQKAAKQSSTDSEIMRALINQVMKATPKQGNERETVTFITRPMWKAFLRATGSPENAEPTEWRMDGKCMRVYGSNTIVLESKKLRSMSFSVQMENV